MRVEKQEFIGKKIKIIESKNKTLENVSGTVIDETKNTITVETEKGQKTIVKNQAAFEIDGKKVEGKKISLRPEDRIKKTKKN
jgi:ribonuclease P protein subunit POP4